MRFADPQACPDCRGSLGGASRCPHCQLDLTSVDARLLWQTLVEADRLLVSARAASAPADASTVGTAAAVVPQASTLPRLPRQAAAQPTEPSRSWTAGSVLLGLGALCLLVAGFIFVTISWGSLGAVGRALVLLAVTALFGVLARWVTLRQLRASAEALWAVFLGLVTLDWFAARAQGLLGLDRLSFGVSVGVWAALLLGAGIAVVVTARPRLGLVVPAAVAGIAPWVAAGVVAGELSRFADWRPFWAAVAGMTLVAAAAAAARWARVTLTVTLCAVGVVLAASVATLLAVAEAVNEPSWRQLVVEAHGLPALVVTLLGAVAAVVGRRRLAAGAVGAVVALVGALALVLLPVEDSWPGRGAVVVAAVAAVTGAAVAAAGRAPWRRGLRAVVVVVAAVLALRTLPWLALVVETTASGARGEGARSFGVRPSDVRQTESTLADAPAWLVVVVGVALVGTLLLARRWPESWSVRSDLPSAAWWLGAAGAISAVAVAEAPFVVLAAVVALGAVVLGLVLRQRHAAWTIPAVVLAVLASVMTLGSTSAALVGWLVAAAALGVLAALGRRPVVSALSAASGAALAGGSAGFAAALLGADGRVVGVVLVLAAACVLAVGGLVRELVARRTPEGWAVEIAAAAVAAAGFTAAATDGGLGLQALLWTVVGVALVVRGLLPGAAPWPTRYRWAGSAALGIAYVLRLVASDVEVVEAYTVPFGLALIVAGLVALRRRADTSSAVALGPALTLLLLPSLPQALDAPTSLRAGLLALGAAVAVGVGLWRQWNAPFVAGAAVLALVVVANLGPYALALPRWVLIAVAGALLLGVGVTWEDRVRDGRSVARRLTGMR